MNLDNLIKEARKNFSDHISLAQKSELFTHYKEIFFRDFDIQSPSFNVDKTLDYMSKHAIDLYFSNYENIHKNMFKDYVNGSIPDFEIGQINLNKSELKIEEKINNSYVLKDLDIDDKSLLYLEDISFQKKLSKMDEKINDSMSNSYSLKDLDIDNESFEMLKKSTYKEKGKENINCKLKA